MGKEISTQPELNQYEIINHKSNVRLWLHDVVDGLIVPGLVTAENLIAGVTLGLDQVYSASDHDHDEDYAALAHNHDTAYSAITHDHDADYAALAHNHDTAYSAITHDHDADYAALAHNHDSRYYNKYLRFAGCNWVGNTTTPTQRTINFIPAIVPDIIIIIAYLTSDTTQGFLGIWWTELIQNIYHFRGHPAYHNAGISTNCFYSAPTAGSFILYDFGYNLSGFNYQALILGKSE